MNTSIIVIIFVLGGVLLLVLGICLTTFFSPIIRQILDELEEKGERVAYKIHSKLHPEPEPEITMASLSQGLKNVGEALRKFSSALGETVPSKDECNKVNGCEEQEEKK